MLKYTEQSVDINGNNLKLTNMLQASLFLIALSLFGFVLHMLATYHKRKFSKMDITLFVTFSIGLIVPTLTLIFNFV